MLIPFGVGHKLLEQAGYTKVMSHVFGKQNEQEYITGRSWHTNKFPRFHIIGNDKNWTLHYDWFPRGASTHSSEGKSQHCRNERARLEKLSKFLAYRSMIKKYDKK